MDDSQRSSAPVRLSLLGHWSLALPSDGPIGNMTAGARRLIALLALRGQTTRAEVRGTLWPNLPEGASATRLRNALWRLSGARSIVLEEYGDMIGLAPDVLVDVEELFAAAARIDEGLQGVSHRQFEADLLPGWDEDWLVVHRERIRQVRLHALERLSDDLLSEGRYALALDAALAALHADPLRESAHRAVISVHLAEGNLSEATQQFNSCRAVLESNLGVTPSQVLRALMSVQARPNDLP